MSQGCDACAMNSLWCGNLIPKPDHNYRSQSEDRCGGDNPPQDSVA